ncbi:MAG: M60 family metallopeptidase, partial [Fimbriimonadaceae bacterium]
LRAAEELFSARLTPDRRAQVAASILQAAACLPEREAHLRPMLARIRSAVSGAVVPSASDPVRADQPLRRIALALEVQEAITQPPERVKAHPAAAVFPGTVPAAAPRVARTIELDGRRAGWISTGLYAAPGEKLTVETQPQAAGLGLSLRIGCHSDTLWHLDRWERAPEVTRVFPIDQPRILAANAFGGLVYIVVPDRGAPAGTKVTIRGAVEAPLFVKGKTSVEDWRERIRRLPAPWAELQADNMIVTVHASAVRNLEDPDAVCQVYDDASDAQADLAGIPRQRRVPERFVVDQQISAGWMHSGYPIMAYTVGVSELSVDSKRLREAPRGETWGHWHELGHNHQSDLWTFEGTVEVTNNVFTLYTMERVSGKKWWQDTHPAMAREETARRLRTYLQAGAPFERWKSDPFLALTMYVQVVDEFGWDAIRNAIASYHRMSPSERPRTDDQKRDAWMRALSRATGRNMGPFFRAWGVPVSDEAVRGMAGLPAWLPGELKSAVLNQ